MCGPSRLNNDVANLNFDTLFRDGQAKRVHKALGKIIS